MLKKAADNSAGGNAMIHLAMRGTACRLALLLSLSIATRSATSPYAAPFSNDSTGPDGPWTYVQLPIDWPSQVVGFYPSLLEMSMVVNATACQAQTARCVVPSVAALTMSDAHNLYRNESSPSKWSPSELARVHGGYVTDLMNLQGSMRYTTERFTLGEHIIDDFATAIADNVTATFPNGDWYATNIGFLSLYGDGEFTYEMESGTITRPLQMYNGYMAAAYPSMSYGLHIGSAMHEIPGRLFYGGYDRARCITPPITTSLNSTFSLADIAIGVASGDSAFLNTAEATFIDGLLQSNISGVSVPLSTQPDPGIPYLYLPAATCAAIARHLPVTYNAGLGLYLWNTSDPAYPAIVSSPHYLSFHFHTPSRSTSDNNTTTTQAIAVPFALLNLTLTYPVATTDTPYFPCRPYDAPPPSSPPSSAASVFLGRAFLQAAHLAHNWHAPSTAWLAQAPGPRHGANAAADEEVKTIDPADTTLSELPAAPLWNETWTGVLVPLERGGAAAAAGNGSLAGAGDGGAGGLSGGAKAGIGVGVVVGVVGVGVGAWLWWGRRTRRGSSKTGEKRAEIGRERAAGLRGGGFAGVVQRRPPRPPEELDGAEMQELPTESERVKELHSKPVQLLHELPGDGLVG